MKTMRTRLARMLFARDQTGDWDEFHSSIHDGYFAQVDAILDEMREADEDAKAAAAEEGVLTGCCLVSADAAGEVWEYMIDHIRWTGVS